MTAACPYCHTPVPPQVPGETRMRQCPGCKQTFFLPAPGMDVRKILKGLMIGATVLWACYLMFACCGGLSALSRRDPGKEALVPFALGLIFCVSFAFYGTVMLMLGILYRVESNKAKHAELDAKQAQPKK